jgi:hypothetical protein
MKRKVYLRGELDHVALTRVPINPRTAFTQVTEKSMMTTQLEDGVSIVGEDYQEDVEELDRKERTQKADVDDLVTKAEQEAYAEHQEQEIILRAMLQDEGYDDEAIEKAQWDYGHKKSLPDSAYAWVEHGAGCEKKDGQTPQRCRHLPYKNSNGSIDCPHTRAALQAIGGARSGKKMSAPGGVKQKLLRALKSCQKSKAELLETELTEYEQGRVDGFNAALELNLPDEEETTMTQEAKTEATSEEPKEKEAKAAIDLDGILASVKPPEEPKEEKAEVSRDEFDTHADLLRQIIAAEGHGREKKWEVAEAVFRSLAAHVSKRINETTPISPEDMAHTIKAQMVEAVQPLMDKVAVLEKLVEGKQPDAPQSKSLNLGIDGPAPDNKQPESEGFYIDPLTTLQKARGNPTGKSQVDKLARQGLFPEDETVL